MYSIRFAILLCSSLALASPWGAIGQETTGGKPALSISFESPKLEPFSGISSLIYEAVRSGRFDRIEVSSRWGSVSETGNDIVQTAAYELQPADDFEECASAALPEYGHFGSFRTTPATQPILFQPTRFDHELVAGHCVIAYPTGKLTANLIVTNGQFSSQVNAVADSETLISDGKQDEIWALTGTQRPTEFDLWNHAGSSKRPDRVSDRDLIRSIRTGGEMQRAALSVIEGRLRANYVKLADGNSERRLERIPQTSSAVVNAILESNVLVDGDDQRRALALRALIAAGDNDQREAVTSQVIEMLGSSSLEKRDAVERAFRQRTNTILGDEYFDLSEGEPLYEKQGFLATASKLALLYGEVAAHRLANAFSDWLYSELLNELLVDTDIVQMTAYGDIRDQLVDALVAKSNQKGGAPPSIQTRIEILISSGFEMSPSLQTAVDRWCARPGGLMPYGDRERAEEFCLKVASHK